MNNLKNYISITISTDDVQLRAEALGEDISYREARETLQLLDRNIDMNTGVSWGDVDYWLEHVIRTRTRSVEDFMSWLPSGSGFDCAWNHIKACKNGTQIFQTYYHNMNPDGYYDGYTKVRLEIPWNKSITEMRIKLSEGKEWYMDYNTRDYMYHTIYNSLSELTNASDVIEFKHPDFDHE